MPVTNAERQRSYRLRHPGLDAQRNGARAAYKRAWNARTTLPRSTSPLAASKVRFVAFDGEGSEGVYQLFACSASARYIAAEGGLSTMQILDYMASLYEQHDVAVSDTLVGYGLSYDFDNILRDVPRVAYARLLRGGTAVYQGYELKLVERKMLYCTFRLHGAKMTWCLQDVLGYFQTSFLHACGRWHIDLPPMVEEYKAKRGTFDWSDIDNIVQYNRMELDALVRLMRTFAIPMFEAFHVAGLRPRFGRTQWYGPGSQAYAMLEACDVGHEVPEGVDAFRVRASDLWAASLDRHHIVLAGGMVDRAAQQARHDVRWSTFQRAARAIETDPWCTAYYGGRIECAMKGHITGALYDYDIASAYPYALTLIPPLRGKTLAHVDGLDAHNRIGVYYVEWQNDARRDYNPFPMRAWSGGVAFPDRALGWYMSPEVSAVAETMPQAMVVREGFVIEGTEGYGSAQQQGQSRIAVMMREAADHRIRLKSQGSDAHVSLKLVLNSVYGKTLQTVGKTTHRNGLLAAWITSVTRAMLWRAIWRMPKRNVVYLQTDGILSTHPLKGVALSDQLGGWSRSTYDEVYMYQPGVYELVRNGVSMMERTRGVHHTDMTTLRGHYADGVTIDQSLYVTRKLAAACPHTYGPYVHRFITVHKDERFPLDRKRMYDMTQPTSHEGDFATREVCWYPPLQGVTMTGRGWFPHLSDQASYPYTRVLQLLDAVAEATEQSEMTGEPAVRLTEAEAYAECLDRGV